MTKAKIFDINGKEIETIDLPNQFDEPINSNLIKRAILSVRASKLQPMGVFKKAGKRASASLSKRRKNYRGSYGHGISRIPRKILWRRGTQFGWEAAFAPGTKGGRKAHPPKSYKTLIKKINKKEARKSIRSALAATINQDLVSKNHKLSEKFPIIIEPKFELFNKTKQVKDLLLKIGLEKEMKRVSKRKIRAGKGKTRGRKYRTKLGPLIIVSRTCPLQKSASNLLGFDIKQVKSLNTELLSNDVSPGRLVIWSKDAILKLGKEKLFTEK